MYDYVCMYVYIYRFPVLLVKSGLTPSRFQSKTYVCLLVHYLLLIRSASTLYLSNKFSKTAESPGSIESIPSPMGMSYDWGMMYHWLPWRPLWEYFYVANHGHWLFRLSDPADDLLGPFMAGYVRFPCDDCDDHPWPGGTWWILYASPSDIGVYLYGVVKS